MAVKPKTTFEPVEMKSGVGWFVRVAPARGKQLQLGGFKREEEARESEWVFLYGPFKDVISEE
jgi:hypothetical protein